MPQYDYELTQDINDAIKRLLDEMKLQECDSDEYAKMADQLIKLHKAQDTVYSNWMKEHELTLKRDELNTTREIKERELDIKEEELNLKRSVSKETWAIIGANIAGILILIGYERANIVTSKALGFVKKLY